MDISNNPALIELHHAFVDGIRKASDVPSDWRYLCEWLRNEDFELVQKCAADNLARIISHGSRRDRPGITHATFFLSPQGVEKIKQNAEAPAP